MSIEVIVAAIVGLLSLLGLGGKAYMDKKNKVKATTALVEGGLVSNAAAIEITPWEPITETKALQALEVLRQFHHEQDCKCMREAENKAALEKSKTLFGEPATAAI